MANRSFIRAKAAKNDEFYTQYETIEKEVKNYEEHLKGKVIYLNCDDPRESEFFNYFSINFHRLGLKKLIASCYKNQDFNLFSNEDIKSKALWVEYNGELVNGVIPTLNEIGLNEFKGDGDFRGEESIELLKQSDIVITNPPFSLFRDLVSQLIEYDKKFLIIGNYASIIYSSIFPLFKNNEMRLGYSKRGIDFNTDNGVKGVNASWFTNLPVARLNKDISLVESYCEDKHPKYVNLDGINIDKVSNIPMDYEGVMGVPVTFIEIFNPKQFELVGFRKGDDGKDLRLEDRGVYIRILIRNITL